MQSAKVQAQTEAIQGLARAWHQLRDQLKPGQTEKKIAHRLERLLKQAGYTRPAFRFIVAVGAHSVQPHHAPSDRKLRSGQPIKIDFGIRHRGWCTDVTRTVFLGQPTPFQRKIYRIVLTAQAAAVRLLKSRADTLLIDRAARQVITRAGFGQFYIHATGHAVGRKIHERPFLSPNPKRRSRLKVGDVVTVEPGVYLPGRFGIRIEDMYLITRTGARCLTAALPKQLADAIWR